jgi:hypothetical protein
METSYSAVSSYSRVSSTKMDGSEPMWESWRTTWWLVMLSLERHQATMDSQLVSAKRPGLGVEWVILGFTESQPVSAKCEELPPEGFAIVEERRRRILLKSTRQDRNGFKPNPNAQSSVDFAQSECRYGCIGYGCSRHHHQLRWPWE